MDKLKFNTNNYDNLFSGRASWMDSSMDFFKESDEPDDELDTDIDDVHSDLEDNSDDDNPDVEVEETETKETEETTDDGDGNEDVEIETSETEDAPKPTEGPDDYDLQEFGNHGGPDVPNNQYNEKDVEILNKLISSESDAINDYFDATTNTVDTNLSRLYGDIGREERFHLEQLLYAKSLITGEKYEPKDPEVKAEYEKLVGDGMDEDTAIITTMDKISIEKPMDDEEFEDLKEDVAQTESYLIQSEMFTEMMMDTEVYSKLVQEYATEMNIYMEDVLNTNTLPKREKYGVNPIRWMIEQFWKFIKFLRKLGTLIREHLARSRAKRNKIKAYISKYGIGAIFQKGYSFYTYNDHTGRFTLEDMIKTSDLLYRTTMIIARNCGLRINAQSPLAADRYGLKPLPVNSAEQGEKFINGMLLTKSRLNIVDNNEEYIINTLFGFSEGDKLNRYTKTLDANGNDVISHDQLSNNFYNAALVTLDHITIAAQYAGEVAKEIENLEGVPDSIYRRNYDTWKKSVNQMKSVMKGFQRIINAMNHDINTMLKIDEYVIQLTNEHDTAQQSGQPYNGETRYTDANKNQPQQNQNNNQQKLVSRFA